MPSLNQLSSKHRIDPPLSSQMADVLVDLLQRGDMARQFDVASFGTARALSRRGLVERALLRVHRVFDPGHPVVFCEHDFIVAIALTPLGRSVAMDEVRRRRLNDEGQQEAQL